MNTGCNCFNSRQPVKKVKQIRPGLFLAVLKCGHGRFWTKLFKRKVSTCRGSEIKILTSENAK